MNAPHTYKRLRLAIGGMAALACWLGVSSCMRVPELSNVPKINFKSSQYIKGRVVDTIRLNFDFEDGDGDLGLRQQDTSAPYNQYVNGQLNPNYYNILVDYFEQNPATGQFDSLATALTYRGRFRPIYEDGKIGQPLTGTISYAIQVLNFPDDRDIMFKIMIKDRALNNSNRISTAPFRIPRQ